MTTNLNRKFNTWATALRSHDSSYLMITRASDDIWYLLSEHQAEPIVALEIQIDNGMGLRPEYSYFVGNPDEDRFKAGIIVKDGAELITNDKNGYYAFGIPDVDAPADTMLVYARTENRCTAILATSKGCHVHTFAVE
jgi:hypothetical protein